LETKVWETLGRQRLPELVRCMGHRADWLELLRRKGDAEGVRERIASLMETADNEAATAASGGAGS